MFISWVLIIALCSLGASEAKREEVVSGLLVSPSQEDSHDEYGEYLYYTEDEDMDDEEELDDSDGVNGEDTEAYVDTPADNKDFHDNLAGVESPDGNNLKGLEHLLEEGALQALQKYYWERKRKQSLTQGERAGKRDLHGQPQRDSLGPKKASLRQDRNTKSRARPSSYKTGSQTQQAVNFATVANDVGSLKKSFLNAVLKSDGRMKENDDFKEEVRGELALIKTKLDEIKDQIEKNCNAAVIPAACEQNKYTSRFPVSDSSIGEYQVNLPNGEIATIRYNGCGRPECVTDTDCPLTKACKQNKCQDPCPGACGVNTECSVRDHQPVCLCLPGYTGNPSSQCSISTHVVTLVKDAHHNKQDKGRLARDRRKTEMKYSDNANRGKRNVRSDKRKDALQKQGNVKPKRDDHQKRYKRKSLTPSANK